MSTPWSGKTSSYHHKWNDTPNPEEVEKAVRKATILDAQWSDCPIEVYEQVKDLWQWAELGNDQYIYKTTIDELTEIEGPEYDAEIRKSVGSERLTVPLKVDLIIRYLREQGVPDTERVWIHFWW